MDQLWAAGLTAAIAALWAMHVTTHREIGRKLNACEERERKQSHQMLLLAKAVWRSSSYTNGDPSPSTFDENMSGLLSDADLESTEDA